MAANYIFHFRLSKAHSAEVSDRNSGRRISHRKEKHSEVKEKIRSSRKQTVKNNHGKGKGTDITVREVKKKQN